MTDHTLKQRIDSLIPEVGNYRDKLRVLLAVSRSSPELAIAGARTLLEDILGSVLQAEGLDGDRDLLNNIEILGATDGKFAARRRTDTQGPIPPPILSKRLHSGLHTLRIYGNTAMHPREVGSMDVKDAGVTATDLSLVLTQVLRLVEWYLQEYPHGPQMSTIYTNGVSDRPERETALHSLPATATEFVGREAELAKCRATLHRPDIRLVTLLGMGGVGKSRLALHVARDLAGEFADGVWWVQVEEARSADALVERIAQVFGIQLQPQPAGRDQLFAFLRDRSLLLVLDNTEQIADAPEVIARMLEAAPALRCLVTTRRALRLQSEYVLELSPLPTDQAVRLFVDRAHAKEARFALTEDNRAAVEALCEYVACLPLGIELAAPHMHAMTPAEMLEELLADKHLLDSDAQDLPDRQRGLDQLIGWSYRLLDLPLQALFAHLAVFAGGFTIRAASQVVLVERVRQGITALIDNSLVISHTDSISQRTRYVMLPLLREYALERLNDAPDIAIEVRHRHRAFFLSYAEERAARMRTAAETEALAELDPERENLQAALADACAARQGADAARLAVAVYELLYRRGFWAEAVRSLESARRAAQVSSEVPVQILAVLRRYQGNLSDMLGDHVRAASILDDALALSRSADDHAGAAETVALLGVLALEDKDFEGAERRFQESLSLRDDGDHAGRSRTLLNLGLAAVRRGDPTKAGPFYEEALREGEIAGDLRAQADALSNLGNIALRADDSDGARRLYSRCLLVRRLVQDRYGIAVLLNNFGVLTETEHPEIAVTLYRHSERIFRDLGSVRAVSPANGLNDIRTAVGPERYADILRNSESVSWESAVEVAMGNALP